MESFKIDSIAIDKDVYEINDYIKFTKVPNETWGIYIIINELENHYESNGVLFHRALLLAIPKVHIRISQGIGIKEDDLTQVLKMSNSNILNVYGIKGSESQIEERRVLLSNDYIEHVKRIHNMVISSGKSFRQNHYTRWWYAYNEYIQACTSKFLETSILHIITGLESILVNSTYELSYRVSLNASLVVENNDNARRDTFKLVKKIYDTRSKITHGDINEIVKLLRGNEIYDEYFEAKRILANVLENTYGMKDTDVIDRLKKIIYNCPPFMEASK